MTDSPKFFDLGNLENQELIVEPHQVQEVIQCILHTIIFQRAFGVIRPFENVIDFLEFYYVQCDDEKIKQYVEERVKVFFEHWRRHNFEPNENYIIIAFEEKRMKSQLFGFSKTEEIFCWEHWKIHVKIDLKRDRSKSTEKLEQNLRQILTKIVDLVNESKSHIPPIRNKDVIPFPYEIRFSGSDSNSGGLFTTLGNMLKTPSSTPLLT